jgi:hypothetical protein
MSGFPTTKALAHIAATPSLAVFGIHSEQDFGASSMRTVAQRSKHPQSVLKMYPGSDHGTAIFTSHPELKGELVKWLQARVN